MSDQTKNTRPLSIGQCATLACLLEVSAPKPGNVHRGADFSDMTLNDFVISATAIGPVMEDAVNHSVGRTVFSAIKATRDMVRMNTNLGTVLLLAPLAKVPRDKPLSTGVGEVLSQLAVSDCHDVYHAIRMAEPGGMNSVDQMDIANSQPPDDLLAAMQAAAERDMVARQYVDEFECVFEFVVPKLCNGCEKSWTLPHSIIRTQLEILAEYSDSLIARKCGTQISEQVSGHAEYVLSTGSPGDEIYDSALADFDFWLRSDGNRRNPGTTADLIAAGLFVALRDGLICPPFHHQ